MRRYLFGLWLVFILVASPPVSAGQIAPELHEVIATASWHEEIPVIVTFTASPAPAAPLLQNEKSDGPRMVSQLHLESRHSQRDTRDFLRSRGRTFEDLWIVNALALEATPAMIDALAQRPEVASVALDLQVEIPPDLPSQTSTTPWNISFVGAPSLWALGAKGQGVTVAVVDTGVGLSHPDLLASWRGGSNSWYDPYGHTTQPNDAHGHGTAVAGILTAGASGRAALGVAPRAKWIAAKAFDDDGTARMSRIILTLQWLLDPNRDGTGRDAPHLVNLSWGFDAVNRCLNGASDDKSAAGSVRQALQALRSAGIGVVAAAGNKGGAVGPSSISPGNFPEVFSVGAVDRMRDVAPFSSRGPSACDSTIYPDIVAPGVSIRSLPDRHWSGTSFAAPHVTGVMALMLSLVPELPIETLEEVLRASGGALGESSPGNGHGFGLVDPVKALELLRNPPLPAQLLSPENESLQGNSVTFRWQSSPDPYGLPVTELLMVSPSEDFSTQVPPLAAQQEVALLAGTGNLLIGWGLIVLMRRGKKSAVMGMAALALLTMSACGGGDDGLRSTTDAGGSEQSVSGLASGTYFWKVVTENAFGEKSESETRLFRIR